jgi:hypothetical protein
VRRPHGTNLSFDDVLTHSDFSAANDFQSLAFRFQEGRQRLQFNFLGILNWRHTAVITVAA